MNVALRLSVLVLLGAGLAGFGLWVRGGAAPVAGAESAAARFESAQQCRNCHAEVFAEWEGSHHQIAFLNPEVRKLSDDFRNKECQACHLPRPVAVTGYGQRVLPRQTHPDEGISCLTCHLDAEGNIVGRHAVPSAPCAPKASASFLAVDLCESCHNQHQTTDQWRASRFAAEGKDCSQCHMPVVDRNDPQGGTHPGRDHRYLGAHDAETLRRAGTFDVQLDGDRLKVSLSNTGAGHNFPTEERHRAVDVEVSFVDGSGTGSDWQRLRRFRQPYRDEPGENTQLPAGTTWSDTVAIPDGTALVRARLWYRLTPFVDDQSPMSTLLFEREVKLP